MILQEDLKFTEANKNKNEAKFKFQGQSARPQRWLDLDFDWSEVNFTTCAPNIHKKLFQRHENTQDRKLFKTFQVPIGNPKCVRKIKFLSDAPMLKYCQKLLNSCCLVF